eukprot:TCALIF_05847-PA protein Name:"Similar to wtap Pre-mRNA-splicing regulator WTAP (Danio rerio)" AED:0.44 eAED:0.44 QI:0/-1/0/1/-1/1/1/0/381
MADVASGVTEHVPKTDVAASNHDRDGSEDTTASTAPAQDETQPISQKGSLASASSVTEADLDNLSPEQLKEAWREQNKYIQQLEQARQNDEHALRDLELKLESSGGTAESHTNRENVLIMRLSAKEREIQILSAQINELKSSQAPTLDAMKATLVDPATNLIMRRLRQELVETKKKMQETQEELTAWKFTPDSVTGKRLMSKCRQLLQENEDIGKMISSGRLSKLESELAMQKTLCQAMKKNEQEMEEFVAELDTDMEGMQSTICFLQQQLKETQEKLNATTNAADMKADLKPEPTVEPEAEPEPETEAGDEDIEMKEEEEPKRQTRGRSTPTKRGAKAGRGAKHDSPQPRSSPGRPKRRRNVPPSKSEDEPQDDEGSTDA